MLTFLMFIGVIVPGPLVDGMAAVVAVRTTLSTFPATEPHGMSPAQLIHATGVGYPPPRMQGARARLMARRAAEVVAVRNLAIKLGHRGRARIRGFRYVSSTYRADGSVEVLVEYPADRRTNGKRMAKSE